MVLGNKVDQCVHHKPPPAAWWQLLDEDTDIPRSVSLFPDDPDAVREGRRQGKVTQHNALAICEGWRQIPPQPGYSAEHLESGLLKMQMAIGMAGGARWGLPGSS